MRSIGQLPDRALAASFAGYLDSLRIENQWEANPDGTYEIWVVADDAIPAALGHLARFRLNPNDPSFRVAASPTPPSSEMPRGQRQRVLRREQIFRRTQPFGVGPLCGFLLLASGVVFLLTRQGEDLAAVRQFTITGGGISSERWLPEVMSGEIWRLFTPVLIHFGWIHLLCNSLMIFSVGSLLEARMGSGYLLGFVFVTAVLPNLAEYWVTGHLLFGGLSGVTFAMSGYAWLRGRYDPQSGIGLEPQSVTMMGVFFVLCWLEYFRLLGDHSLLGIGRNVANVVHTAGLAIGCLWGWWDAQRQA